VIILRRSSSYVIGSSIGAGRQSPLLEKMTGEGTKIKRKGKKKEEKIGENFEKFSKNFTNSRKIF